MKLGGGAVRKDLRLAKALRRFEGAIVVEGGKFYAESMLNFAIISTARAMVYRMFPNGTSVNVLLPRTPVPQCGRLSFLYIFYAPHKVSLFDGLIP